MNKLLKKISILSAFLVSISCTSLVEDEIHLPNSRQDEWAADLINDCYALSGVYASIGEVRRIGEQSIEPARLESSIFSIENLEIGAHSVAIEKESGSPLTVSVKDKGGDILVARTFDTLYTCDEPWLVYESRVDGSGDGSPVLSTRTVTKFARSKDRGLIVSINTITVSRDWFFFKIRDSIESWYRFPEIR